MGERERMAATMSELDRVAQEINGVIAAIKAGVPIDVGHARVQERTKIEQLSEALQTEDVEQREAARSGLRALITKIVIAPGDEFLRVPRNLGERLATAASGRDVSTLAGIAQSGCGGSQPSVVVEGDGMILGCARIAGNCLQCRHQTGRRRLFDAVDVHIELQRYRRAALHGVEDPAVGFTGA